jgi:hypothetical protein
MRRLNIKHNLSILALLALLQHVVAEERQKWEQEADARRTKELNVLSEGFGRQLQLYVCLASSLE